MNSMSRGEQRFWDNWANWKETPSYLRIPRDLLRVDWKSDKERGMDYGHTRLSPAMFACLTVLLQGGQKKPQRRTVEALRWRGLVDADGELTAHGRTLALARLSLRQQCKFLGLPLEEIAVASLDHPEETVRRTLAADGIRAHFVENAFGLFIDILIGDALIAVAERLDKQIFTLNPPYDPELFFWVKRDLEHYLDQLDDDHYDRNLVICAPFIQTIIVDQPQLQIFGVFGEMYRSMGIEKTKSLLRMYFANPLAYNYRGWPDLFVALQEDAYCVEVKTTDRLHLNQLITIPDLVRSVGLPVRVARLRRPR